MPKRDDDKIIDVEVIEPKALPTTTSGSVVRGERLPATQRGLVLREDGENPPPPIPPKNTREKKSYLKLGAIGITTMFTAAAVAFAAYRIHQANTAASPDIDPNPIANQNSGEQNKVDLGALIKTLSADTKSQGLGEVSDIRYNINRWGNGPIDIKLANGSSFHLESGLIQYNDGSQTYTYNRDMRLPNWRNSDGTVIPNIDPIISAGSAMYTDVIMKVPAGSNNTQPQAAPQQDQPSPEKPGPQAMRMMGPSSAAPV